MLDPLLAELSESGLGVSLGGASLACLGFADDVLLVSDTFEGLKALFSRTTAFMDNIGLALNPKKTQYFGWRVDHYLKHFRYDIPAIMVGDTSVAPVE